MAISFLCLRLAYENKINTNNLLDAEEVHPVNPVTILCAEPMSYS